MGVFISLDGGVSWQREDTGFPNTVVHSLAFENSTNSLYAFTFGRGVWRVRLGGDPCVYSVNPTSLKFNAAGSRSSLALTTGDSCTWSLVPGTAPVVLDGPATGIGSNTLNFTVSQNLSAVKNTGTLFIGDQKIAVEQAGALTASRNDERASAFAVPDAGNMIIEDNRTLTEATNDPVHSCSTSKDLKTAWFSFTAPYSGSLNIGATIYRISATGTLGTVITAYQDTSTTELGCVSNRANGAPASLNLNVTQGTKYVIEVSAAGPTNTGGLLAISITDPR